MDRKRQKGYSESCTVVSENRKLAGDYGHESVLKHPL